MDHLKPLMQTADFLGTLRSVARLGVPLRRFIYPNIVMIVLEVASLYLLARLLTGVLSAAAGLPIDLMAAAVLAVLLVLKSAINAFLTRSIYRGYMDNEVKLRQVHFDLARRAASRLLRARSVETVTHELNVYPANLTYNVYQQAVKLLSDLVIAFAIMVALLINNPQLTVIILALFGTIALVMARITIRISTRAGRVTDQSTIRLVNLLGRFLGGRNEITDSPIERTFETDIATTNRALSDAHGDLNYVALVPRFAFDAVTGVAILVVVGAVGLGWARLDQKDLAFSLAAGLKLAPYLTSIIAGLLQITFARAIAEGFAKSTALISVDPDDLPGVAVDLRRESDRAELVVTAAGHTVRARGGELLLIRGRSGSGKTTIAELVADVATGRVNRPAAKSEHRWDVAYCAQFATVLNKSLHENVADGSHGYERVDALLVRYGLGHLLNETELNENTLSGGERQRIGIVRAVNQASEISVFDEPTASVGALYADKVREDLAALAKQGSLVVVISHETTFDTIADCVLELQ